MFDHSLTNSAVLLALMALNADAQTPPGRAYKVAFWFEVDRPFSTVQYRAYDTAKGEYHPEAVDRWLKTIFANHPHYGAMVRDVSTAGEAGADEAERLKNAIEHEKRRWADFDVRDSRSTPRLVGPSAPPGGKIDSGHPPTNFNRRAPGDSGIPMDPAPSPFPYPYRSGPR